MSTADYIAEGGCGCDGYEEGGAYTGGDYKEEAAAFGRVYSVLGALVGIIIAIICIVVGYSKLRDPHTATAMGIVTKVSRCTPAGQSVAAGYACLVDATYLTPTKTYTATNLVIQHPAPLAVGATFTLHYDPANPQSAVYEMSPRGAGWALIGFGLLLGGITTGIAAMTFKSENFAAGYGTVEGASLVARAI